MNTIDLSAVLIILGVAVATYTLRVSGLLFSNNLAKEGKIKVFLDYLPATLLLSLVIPSILKEGFVGVIASLCIVICMKLTKSILLSMLIGVLIIALSRNIIYM